MAELSTVPQLPPPPGGRKGLGELIYTRIADRLKPEQVSEARANPRLRHAIDLIVQLLQYAPSARLSATNCLRHKALTGFTSDEVNAARERLHSRAQRS